MKLALLLLGMALLGALVFLWIGFSKTNREMAALQDLNSKGTHPRTSDDTSGSIIERFGPKLPPKSLGEAILIYRVRLPRCPFEEIAEVRASAFDNGKEDELRRILRKKVEELAREVGGDAVGGIYEYSLTRVIGGMGGPAIEENHRQLTATVLRFTDPGCRE